MYFPAKKDIFYKTIIWGVIIISFVPLFFAFDWIALITLLLLMSFLIWLYFSTGYLIEGEQLIIKFGPFRKKININDISKLSKTRNLLSSYAFSFDRIEIMYNSFDIVYISPLHQKEFIHFLLQVNPNINVDEKLEIEKKATD